MGDYQSDDERKETMKVIRDPVTPLTMIPLFVDWHVRRCNIIGCRARPTTIILGIAKDMPPVGLCEAHYQQGNVPGGATFEFEFDDFDAFKQPEGVSHV